MDMNMEQIRTIVCLIPLIAGVAVWGVSILVQYGIKFILRFIKQRLGRH